MFLKQLNSFFRIIVLSNKNFATKMLTIKLARFHDFKVVNPTASLLPIQNSLINFTSKYGMSSDSTEQTETMKLFEKVKPLINDKLKDEINAVMVFCVSGKNYLFDSHSSRPLKIEMINEPPKEVDVTMIMDEAIFIKLVKGEMKAANAFMSGKLKIKGNIQLAMKAEKMFTALQK